MQEIERNGKITIECYGMSFSKSIPEKVAFAILMDNLPKPKQKEDAVEAG